MARRAEPSEVSKHQFSLAYSDSSRPDDHTIDVADLAPALMAVGKLIRAANAEFNGTKATSKVLVASDFEHRCFNINFEVVVGLYEQVKIFLALESVHTAKELVEWVGIGSAGGFSLLRFLGHLRGRKIESVTTIRNVEGGSLVEVKIEGDEGSVVVNSHVYNLSQDTTALSAARDAFIPVKRGKFDTVEVKDTDGRVLNNLVTEEIDNIIRSCTSIIESNKDVAPNVREEVVWLSVYSPVYDLRAKHWRFKLGREVITADISETSISEDALARGSAFAEDSYQVVLEITTDVDKNGEPKETTYKIKSVSKFIPAEPPSRQSDLFDHPGS